MKIREIYTVTREHEIKNLQSAKELIPGLRYGANALYNGSPQEELLVKFQIYNNNGWEDFDPEN